MVQTTDSPCPGQNRARLVMTTLMSVPCPWCSISLYIWGQWPPLSGSLLTFNVPWVCLGANKCHPLPLTPIQCPPTRSKRTTHMTRVENSRESCTKLIPQTMLQIQPTMTTNVSICRKAETRLSPKARRRLPLRGCPQQHEQNDEMNVPTTWQYVTC